MKIKDKLNDISSEVATSKSQEYTEENAKLLLHPQNHINWLKLNYEEELKKSAWVGEQFYTTPIYGKPKVSQELLNEKITKKENIETTYSNYVDWKRVENKNYHIFYNSFDRVHVVLMALKMSELGELEDILNKEEIKIDYGVLQNKDDGKYFIALTFSWINEQ